MVLQALVFTHGVNRLTWWGHSNDARQARQGSAVPER